MTGSRGEPLAFPSFTTAREPLPMSEPAPTVLVAGFSGRALAASARRAGYVPLVADAYGDEDTRALAGDVRTLPHAVMRGFAERSLTAALDELAADAPAAPVGLVLGAGFEDDPDLIFALSRRFNLLGCQAGSVRAAKDPATFFPLLESLGIAHPETRTTPPDDGRGWLSKRIGGSGGGHIAVCRQRVAGVPGRYYQRRIEGDAVSMLGVVNHRRAAFAFTSQWAAPMPRRPFRYGGAAGSIDVEADLEARMIDIGLDLTRALSLAGLVSFDFIVADGVPHLIELNPRPGASLDVLDDDTGTLFTAHLAACEGDDPTLVLEGGWRPKPRAAAYVYADAGDLEVPAIAWPEWVSDRPATGTHVPRHRPIATVHATGPDVAAANRLLDKRIGELTAMIYPRP